MKFDLHSRSFDHNAEMPKQFTGEGENESPDLYWSNVPKGTKEFALICEDPDAPQEKPWVHWLLYKIPVDIQKLPFSIPSKGVLDIPPGAMQGKNSFGNLGYGGPLPPEGHGWHRYFFKLYALNAPIDVTPGMSKEELVKAMEGHVLGAAEMMARYKRQGFTNTWAA